MRAVQHIRGARVWTGDPARPWADSLTIGHGRVAAVGESGDGAAADATLDLGGRVATPGLVDAHLHLIEGGLALERLDLSGVASREAFEAAVAARCDDLPDGAWLIAHGWSSERWPSREDPDLGWLRAAGDRPAVCYRMDLHAVLVNEPVLARCDLARDPPGGRIVRDRAGAPTGLLVETAAWRLVNPIVPAPDVATRRAALRAAQAHCHARGLTAARSMEYAATLRDVLAPCRGELTLRCRFTLLDRAWPMSFDEAAAFPGDERLAVIGSKAFVDGTLGSRTARLLAPYADRPDERGTLVELAADGHLAAWARAVAAAGLAPAMHAIGDEAVRLALDALEGVDPAVRPTIEHAQQIDPADLPRFDGVVASMQPLHRADDGLYAEARLGRARLAGTFPLRSLREAGARLAFGSDWPVVSCDPVLGMQSAITGRTSDGAAFAPDQTLDVEAALRAYTRDAAWAIRLDDAGVLRPGALADLTVFADDPFAADWTAAPPRVAMTVVGGEVVYDGGLG